MKYMNVVKKIAQNRYAQAGVALTLSGSAMANDANTTAITDAITSGKALVSTTTSGVIALAALGFGVGMVVTWLAKR
ncbi:hypothetical protein OPW36_14115 [Vibrio europaeus]|uniref:hypothetical protein n=1 Tax=Vibrio europaeus TaxID=300876 RepID=UPI00233E8322|nr:hypothetical protein [Vibrio europaeus]MDC5804753.1 hypothetical protein [Vibrio europaeus]MDC5825846.1 hypothetical protein [Vibrio europaeus]MDC5829084.1 hypothetical protein [Vibrio europaeus]MDC5833553.1 hypothetical protein [Vibrio europaeus]MDC5855733.1 hypothetical protein [Vibrio europaeus]